MKLMAGGAGDEATQEALSQDLNQGWAERRGQLAMQTERVGSHCAGLRRRGQPCERFSQAAGSERGVMWVE